MSLRTITCPFCQDEHDVGHVGATDLPMVACPKVPSGHAYIGALTGLPPVMFDVSLVDGATQTADARYNPSERVPLTIREPIMNPPAEEPDFAIAVRRGLAARRHRNKPRAFSSPAIDAELEELVRDELDRMVAEYGPQTDLSAGCPQQGDSDRADAARMASDDANESNTLSWRHLVEEDTANVFAAIDPAELYLGLVRLEARARKWRLALAAKRAEAEPEPERPAETVEQAVEDQAAMDDLAGVAHVTHYMDNDKNTPLCGFDGGNLPVRGTDRPELVTCDACKTLYEARFTR